MQDSRSASNFRRVKVQKRLYHSEVSTHRFTIPPQTPAHRLSARRTLDFDASLLGVVAHMHVRATDMDFLAQKPDGSNERLLLIPNYNFDWQLSYRWAAGIRKLPKGTVLEAVGHYDNTSFNPFNPDPTASVRFGEQTFQEMLMGFFFYTRDDEKSQPDDRSQNRPPVARLLNAHHGHKIHGRHGATHPTLTLVVLFSTLDDSRNTSVRGSRPCTIPPVVGLDATSWRPPGFRLTRFWSWPMAHPRRSLPSGRRSRSVRVSDQIAPIDPALDARRFEGEPRMTLVDLSVDVLVAGGGPAGVCAALAAARNGVKVLLVQDRSRLGGNSSSEVKMHVVGANNHTGRPGWREGGIIEELRLDDAANNPQRCWELWDLLLYDKVVSEPNITLLLDTAVYAVESKDGQIQRVMARSDKTEHLYRIVSKLYLDCTGDSRLALEAGATIRWGHESRQEFKEPLAWAKPTRETLGSSVLFTARDFGRPMPYSAPKWARKIDEKQLRFRPISLVRIWLTGGSNGVARPTPSATTNASASSCWRSSPASGITSRTAASIPKAANWAMDWVGMVPGKRESGRIEGDHILTQQDLNGPERRLQGRRRASAAGGSTSTRPSGFDDARQAAVRQHQTARRLQHPAPVALLEGPGQPR